MWEGEGYPGDAFLDGALTIVRAGHEAFLTVEAELHEDECCYAPQPCFARVRLIAPGQTFTAAYLEENQLKGTAEMTSRTGDLELCFCGSFGNYCHIMRRVPSGKACCPDPLACDYPLMDKNPAGRWWVDRNEPRKGGNYKYFDSWFKKRSPEGELLYPDSEGDEEEDGDEEEEQD